MRIVFLAWVTAGLGSPNEGPEVWVFFSFDSPGAGGIIRQLKERKIEFRPVFLTEHYVGSRRPGRELLETLRVSGEVRVVDVEGLRKAKELGIRRLPAVAVVHGGRAHVAAGARADVREVLRCAR